MIITSPDQIKLRANPKYADSGFEKTKDYLGSPTGIFKVFQTATRSLALTNQVMKDAGSESSPILTEAQNNLGIATAAMGLPRIPEVTEKAYKDITGLQKLNSNDPAYGRKVSKTIKSVTEAVSSWLYLKTFFKKNPAIARIAKSFDLTNQVTDLTMSLEDWSKASSMEAKLDQKTASLKATVNGTKMIAVLRTAKNITGIAATVFGILFAAMGAPLFPTVVLLGLALASSLLAINEHFYKANLEFKPIDFYATVV